MLSTAVLGTLHLAQLSMDKLKHPAATGLACCIRACPLHYCVEQEQSHEQGSHQGFKTSRIRLQGTKPSWWSERRKQRESFEESKSSTPVFQSCVDNYFPYDTCSSQTFRMLKCWFFWMLELWKCKWCWAEYLADISWLIPSDFSEVASIFCQLWIWPIKPVYHFLESISTDRELIACMLTFLSRLSTAVQNTLDCLCRGSTDSLFL